MNQETARDAESRTAAGRGSVALKNAAKKLVIVFLAPCKGAVDVLARTVWYARFMQWKREHPCRGFPWRIPLHEFILESERLDREIDYLEFGVAGGTSLTWWLERNRHPKSLFFGFDTFQGLPEAWGSAPAGQFAAGGTPPAISDSRCVFEVGLFQDTLPAFLGSYDASRRKLIHLDADLYSSTLFVLVTLRPCLRAGDILLFDEFMWAHHEFRAFWNFLEACPLRYELLGATDGYAQLALKVL